MNPLPDAPAHPWADDGSAGFGTFRGECEALPIDEHFGRLARIRSQKRWLWCGVMSSDIAVGLAVVRTGYAANVFCWVFDRASREFLQDTSRMLPRMAVEVAATPPLHGVVARYRAVVEGVAVRRDGEIWRIEGTIGDTHLDLEIVEEAPPSTAICPVGDATDDPRINVTRKQAMARAAGVVRVGTRRIDVVAAAGLLDHSHGMLAGETVWQWAIGAGHFDDGQAMAFNAVAGFNHGLENTIWLNGEPSAAGQVTFEIPDDRTAPWRVFGDRVDLVMEPEGLRAQELDLGVVASDYLQPLGRWHGTVDGRGVEAHGVAELHRSVW